MSEVRASPQQSALERDLARRVGALQALMRDHDLAAAVAVATGMPSRTGWLRYLTAAELLDGQAYVLVQRDHPEPVVFVTDHEHVDWLAETAVAYQAPLAEDRLAPDVSG